MIYKSKINKKETKEEHLQRIRKALSYNGKMRYHVKKRITAIHEEIRLLKTRLSENITESKGLLNETLEPLDPKGVRLMDLHYERERVINHLLYNRRALLMQSICAKRMKYEQKRLNKEYNKKFKRFYGNK